MRLPTLTRNWYTKRVKLRGVRGTVDVFTFSGGGSKVLRKTALGVSKRTHAMMARAHRRARDAWEKVWGRAADRAAMETFGRKFQFGDYKISAVGRDEFPERLKKILRKAAISGSKHAQLAAAHAVLAGSAMR